jgi:hypothetical protein
MKKRNIVSLIGVLLIILALWASSIRLSAQAQPSNQEKTPDEAAEVWLGIFRETVNEENFKALGFLSLEEVEQTKLGAPMTVFMVGLDSLREYQPRSDPEKLLIDIGRVIYPVNVQEKVRVSLEVGLYDGEWTGKQFGEGNLAKLFSRTRENESDFVVWIPAFNQYFIASRAEPGLILTPILDDPHLELQAGIPIPAEELFTQLIPAAKRLEDLPK